MDGPSKALQVIIKQGFIDHHDRGAQYRVTKSNCFYKLNCWIVSLVAGNEIYLWPSGPIS